MLDCHKLVLLCCTNCTESVFLHGLNLFLFVPFIWNVTINVSVVSITMNLISYRGAFISFCSTCSVAFFTHCKCCTETS